MTDPKTNPQQPISQPRKDEPAADPRAILEKIAAGTGPEAQAARDRLNTRDWDDWK